MAQHEVTRTLVKSQPEVWTQCSDADSLGRHLGGSFGEIRITKLEPEHAVAWEGEEVSGTVRIEPSAWGTRVTLTADMADEIADLEEAAPAPEVAEADPEPPLEAEIVAAADDPPEIPTPDPGQSLGLWARFRARWRRRPAEESTAEAEESLTEPEPLGEPDPLPAPAATVDEVPVQELVSAEPPREELAAPEPPAEEPADESASRPDTAGALSAALESLGQAHHRPFSRA